MAKGYGKDKGKVLKGSVFTRERPKDDASGDAIAGHRSGYRGGYRGGYRWLFVLAGGTWLLFWGMGLRHGFGLFAAPLSNTIGLSIGSFSLAVAIQNLLWGLASPFCGALADRYGAGRVAVLGALCYAAGMGIMGHSVLGFYSGQMLIGVGLAATTFGVVFGALSRAAPPSHQSMGLGLVSTAGSVGAFAVVPLEGFALANFELPVACALLALCTLSMLPGAFALKERKRPSLPPLRATVALARATRHGSYALLTTGFFVCGFQVVFIAAHLPNYFADIGLPRSTATTALSLIGLGNIAGTLLSGWLGGKIVRKKTILTLIYLLRSVVIVLFLLADKTPVTAAIFASLMGFLWLSTVPPTSGLVLSFFGAPNMAMLYGVVFVSHQLGSFFGAWLGGVIFRAFHSYDPMWWLAVLLGLVAAALHYPIKEERGMPVPAAA